MIFSISAKIYQNTTRHIAMATHSFKGTFEKSGPQNQR